MKQHQSMTVTSQSGKPNRLITEKSPYLQQHAHNPVDWYPWGEEAFASARNQQKPIFLSVGYSTCHWCHVMERESFENASVAAVLNEKFVPIKVDREERPDVDRVYMNALQAMGQNGGWPMSMFLTPDLKPFYGGTYFPPDSRFGKTGFTDVLLRIDKIWNTERTKVDQSAHDLTTYLEESVRAGKGDAALTWDVPEKCFDQLQQSFDDAHAGFGRGSKFPRPVSLAFLLRYYKATRNKVALDMVERTLRAMADGGLHDHVGGGFHRYCVDSEWRVPHFEKMLYDQAQIIEVNLEAYQITGSSCYADVARSTCAYVLRDMTSSEGGFYSAEDADSPLPENPAESGEGFYYLWTKQEIINLLGEKEGRLFVLAYGVEEDGNAPMDPQQEFAGKNILFEVETVNDLARILGKQEQEVRTSLEKSREQLLEARNRRPRPKRDDKIVLSWNGLMIGALARAATILDQTGFREAAEKAAGDILARMHDPSTGLLLRRMRDGEARFEGHLADYAFFVKGLIELFETTQDSRWLKEATELCGSMITLFHDPKDGGFFETNGKDPSVLVRLKEHYDGAEPSGNSIAAENLIRLASLTGNDEWRALAERALMSFSGILASQPVAMPNMVSSLVLLLSSPIEVVIVGSVQDVSVRTMVKEFYRRFLPSAILLVIDTPGQDTRSMVHPLFRSFSMREDKPTAYVCENYACALPTNDPGKFNELLDRASSTPLNPQRRISGVASSR